MKRGFTLIELLTVIAIIGILTSIIVVSSGNARQQARDAKRKSDLNGVSTALEMYYANQRKYPVVGAGWAPLETLSITLADFLSSMPIDPSNSEPFIYQYCTDSTATATKYVLDVALENKNESITNTSFTTDDLFGSGCNSNVSSFFTGTYAATDSKVHYRVTNK